MKRALITFALVTLSTVALAQGGTSLPNGLGGYNYFGYDGSYSTSLPNGLGGYNTFGNDGSYGTSLPNGLGGYNYFGTTPRGHGSGYGSGWQPSYQTRDRLHW